VPVNFFLSSKELNLEVLSGPWMAVYRWIDYTNHEQLPGLEYYRVWQEFRTSGSSQAENLRTYMEVYKRKVGFHIWEEGHMRRMVPGKIEMEELANK